MADPHRPGHELTYHPGEANLRMADVVVINKIDTADLDHIAKVRDNIMPVNPNATVVEAASPIFVDDPAAIKGKSRAGHRRRPHADARRDGLWRGRRGGAALRRERRSSTRARMPSARSSRRTRSIRPPAHVLPAMGYGAEQMNELGETINNTPCDLVIVATPIDLRRVVEINRPSQRVRYELQEIGQPTLVEILEGKFGRKK